MKQVIRLVVNGDTYEVLVKPSELLLDVLRYKIGLTGTKEGCDTGKCGACTVLVDGEAVRSCLTLAISLDDKEITTIEGLAEEDNLHPLQQSFIERGAIQCGFCTPGMIMTAKAFLDENSDPTEDEVKEAIGSNICRCTGYSSIIEAIKAAAVSMTAQKRESGGKEI